MKSKTMHSFNPATDSDKTAHILNVLRPRLPLSLPVYRRIQFRHFSPSARIITSFDTSPAAGEPWLVVFSDPDRGPETQLFLHGSWETSSSSAGSDVSDEVIAGLMEALVLHLRSGEALYAPSLRTEIVQARVAAVAGEGYDPATDGRHLVMMGSVHARTAKVVRDLGLLDPEWAVMDSDGMPEAYNKWVFDLRNTTGHEDVLPDGLRWGTMRTPHYALVRSRTAIPRQDRTLSILPTVAIFPAQSGDGDVDPVGWLFLGVDSSLTTLHVEPEYRGKGLAKILARKAWKQHLDHYRTSYIDGRNEVNERWAHADVATGNVASNAVCKSLGGKVEWTDYWMKLDLTRLSFDEHTATIALSEVKT